MHATLLLYVIYKYNACAWRICRDLIIVARAGVNLHPFHLKLAVYVYYDAGRVTSFFIEKL